MVYHWPGNIRELENCIERACILSTDNVLRTNNLPASLQTAEGTQTMQSGTLDIILGKMEKQIIEVSNLLKNRSELRKGDFSEIIKDASSNDLIYMDPPWQGTSNKSNPRYAFLLNLDELIASFEDLNKRKSEISEELTSNNIECMEMEYGAAMASYQAAKYKIPSACPEVMYRYYDGGTGEVYNTDLDCMNTEYMLYSVTNACAKFLYGNYSASQYQHS